MRQRFRTGYAFLARLLASPQVFILFPAVLLTAYWGGGERALMLSAITMMVIGGALAWPGLAGRMPGPTDALTGLPDRDQLIALTDQAIDTALKNNLKTATLVLETEGFATLSDRHGRQAADDMLIRIATRLAAALRGGDHIARLEGARFGITLSPVARASPESLLQISARLQNTLSEPFVLHGASLYVSASVGFCRMENAPRACGRSMLRAAETALFAARRSRPGAVRDYTDDMRKQAAIRRNLSQEIDKALEIGQIRPWFQPQVSADTGEVSGFEALARWEHPERGIIPPAEFLPVIDEAGLSERLSEAILHGALTTLSSWDKAELNVPAIAVNFASGELHNPRLAERVGCELKGFGLSPRRLTIEILESVIARSDEDMVTRNIRALSDLGCGIDLDDFGIGHASILNIRRFGVHRIKIDRTFITHILDGKEQERMVAAILTMAERLGLETVAEGVEKAEEHALLAQLGCTHVQGYAIAPPMPAEGTPAWLMRYRDGLVARAAGQGGQRRAARKG